MAELRDRESQGGPEPLEFAAPTSQPRLLRVRYSVWHVFYALALEVRAPPHGLVPSLSIMLSILSHVPFRLRCQGTPGLCPSL